MAISVISNDAELSTVKWVKIYGHDFIKKGSDLTLLMNPD